MGIIIINMKAIQRILSKLYFSVYILLILNCRVLNISKTPWCLSSSKRAQNVSILFSATSASTTCDLVAHSVSFFFSLSLVARNGNWWKMHVSWCRILNSWPTGNLLSGLLRQNQICLAPAPDIWSTLWTQTEKESCQCLNRSISILYLTCPLRIIAT